MKIININYSDFSGGSAIACSRLHEGFLENNLDSWLAVCLSNNKIRNSLTFNKKKNKIEYLIKKNLTRLFLKYHEKKTNIDFSLSFFDNPLFKEIQLHNFDLINLHWIGNETLSLKQIGKINKPLVWTLTDMWPFLGTEHINLSMSNNDYWNNEKILNNKNFDIKSINLKEKIKNYPNQIQPVAISKWLAERASESLIFKEKSIKVIPCTLNFDIWKPADGQRTKQNFFEKNKKIILFSSSGGTGDYKKGFKYLVKALQKFKNLKDYHLVILGRLIRSDIQDLNITYTEIPKLLFNNVDQLIKIYSSVDLLVVPSILEAFGQVAVEAASCNVPTVAFKNTGLEEIVDHKINGYLANFKNDEDLFTGIKWCLEDKNLDELKKNCRQNAINKFSNKIIVNKYQDLYKKLI